MEIIPTIYCFIGKSGAGKTRIAKTIRDKYGIGIVKTCTTRQQRNSEEENDYYFCEEAVYEMQKNAELILEETAIDSTDDNGGPVTCRYWTLKSEFGAEQFGINNSHVYSPKALNKRIFICDLKGVENLRKIKNFYANIVVIYIATDNAIRFTRLVEESTKPIEHDRLEEATQRMSRNEMFYKVVKCDYLVDNSGSLDETISNIEAIMGLI